MMLRLSALLLFLWMTCGKGLAQQQEDDDPPMMTMMTTTTTTSGNDVAPTCSCDEEIRHCDQLLAEKDENCAESRRESFQQCDELLQASKEASVQASQANQSEIKKLTEIVTQIRGQKDAIQNECERRVSDSYSRGWREAEVQYGDQLNASKEAMQQSRTAHQTEIERLASVINQLREQRETTHTGCERRVTESYSLGLREAETTAKKQVDKLERQLSSAKLLAQVRSEHFAAEKARLEKDNRDLRRSLSRVQTLLLETQRDLASAKGERWMILRAWDAVNDVASQTWDLFLATHVQAIWDARVKGPWEKYGLSQWNRAQFLYKKCRLHGPLALNLAVDAARVSISEIVSMARNFPENSPYLVQSIWDASKPLRTQTYKLYEQTSSSLSRTLSTNVSSARTRLDSIWGRVKEELHLEELNPHINAVRAQMEHIDHAMSPQFERANRVWQDIKGEFKILWQSMKQVASNSLDRIGAFFKQVADALVKKKDFFVEEFSLTARTAFLLMKAYQAPKIARDIAEFCHSRPEAALRCALEYLIGFMGCLWFARRFMLKRKRLSHRKVQFAVTQ